MSSISRVSTTQAVGGKSERTAGYAAVGDSSFLGSLSRIAKHCVPYRHFAQGSSNCSEGKGHTFESCRVRHFGTPRDLARR